MEKRIKICLACSAGGHLTEMRQLDKLYKKHDYFFLTEDTDITRDFAKSEKIYLLKLINRRKYDFFFLLFYNTIMTIKYLIIEKPDIIICTGALCTVPCCLFGKLMGRKLIYIESFAKTDTPSMTGNVVKKFADLFIVQWEKLLQYYPKAVYGGSIF